MLKFEKKKIRCQKVKHDFILAPFSGHRIMNTWKQSGCYRYISTNYFNVRELYILSTWRIYVITALSVRFFVREKYCVHCDVEPKFLWSIKYVKYVWWITNSHVSFRQGRILPKFYASLQTHTLQYDLLFCMKMNVNLERT